MSGRVAFVVLLAAAGLFAGCGGEEAAQETETQEAAAAADTITVRETEFALDPAQVRLDAAGTYTFRAVNDGSVDHALEIEGNGVEDETETIGAGESADVTVELAEGTYELYCPVGNHKDMGMAGTVVVGAGGATTGTTGDDTPTTGGDTTTTTGETETDDDDGSNSGPGEGYGY